LLEGSGSNVYTAKVTEVLRRAGHDVLLLCQEPHPGRFGFLDSWGTVGPDALSELTPTGVSGAEGRAVLLRPEIGSLLPVFVVDEYEGFTVKRFVDLTDAELAEYIRRNAAALRTAAEWHGPEAVVVGHAVAGPAIARRALGDDAYVVKIHGSDLEYAVRLQRRYVELAREGLGGARAITGSSSNVLARLAELIPSVAGRTRVVTPGVEVDLFRPRSRREGLEGAAAALERDPDTGRGRPAQRDGEVQRALDARDGEALDSLALQYDQAVPDPDAAARLRRLAGSDQPLVGYFGKLIPEKGVERLIEGLALARPPVRGLIVGFGTFREWLAALVLALSAGDAESARWLGRSSRMQLELPGEEIRGAAGLAERIAFTGRLDHRYAPGVLAALDVLAVPSTLSEAFGMVAAEGAAAGALPLVARHSGLAEVAAALEEEVGRPGMFSFEPGPGATRRLSEGIERLLAIPPEERGDLRATVSAYVAREWTWERTAERLLRAAAV
jgi:glycosyltransferase involved in cell wall biosynthesis